VSACPVLPAVAPCNGPRTPRLLALLTDIAADTLLLFAGRREAECGRKRPAWTQNLTCTECVGDVLKDIARREPQAKCGPEGQRFEKEHCDEKPVADDCLGVLDLYGCWSANSTQQCMTCVTDLDDWLKRLRCTAREEQKYCGGPEPIPGPVSEACKDALIKACEPFGGDHGTVRECDKCTRAANATACTSKEELSFCLPALPFKPSETSCEHHLKKECGDVQRDPEKCDACIKKAVEPPGSTNCSHREEEVFCKREPEPPAPPAPPVPGGNSGKYTCNSTLGVCHECPPDDPEAPPWASVRLRIHL
jgi:hypothetical protein